MENHIKMDDDWGETHDFGNLQIIPYPLRCGLILSIHSRLGHVAKLSGVCKRVQSELFACVLCAI